MEITGASPMAQRVKNPRAMHENTEDADSISGLGRSPGGRNGNPPQYSCLENPMDRGFWWATVQRITESDTTKGLSTPNHMVTLFAKKFLNIHIHWCHSRQGHQSHGVSPYSGCKHFRLSAVTNEATSLLSLNLIS